MMNDQSFPTEHYLRILVRFLDTIKYQDDNFDRSERLKNLRYASSEVAKHFAQPLQQATFKASPKKLEASLRTISMMVVYSWAKLSPQIMATLATSYMYTLFLDDSNDDPHPEMASFFDDLVHGRQPKHPWWRLMVDHLPSLLKHYGGYGALTIIRSMLDFFQGCWIEQHNFHGFPGAHPYPPFLRRLTGLGQSVGATLFPAEEFDEQALFTEITTAIAQVETVVIWVNDLFSFWKEFDEPHDQTNLIRNNCHVEGISLDQAFERLTRDAIQCCEQMHTIFEGKDPKVVATIEAFVQGYVTWHLCDNRYRMNEMYERSGDNPVGVKFRHYYELARKVGEFDEEEWPVPSISTLVQQANESAPSVHEAETLRSLGVETVI